MLGEKSLMERCEGVEVKHGPSPLGNLTSQPNKYEVSK